MTKTKLIYQDSLDWKGKNQNVLLIYDEILKKKYSQFIAKFPRKLSVQSGEALKDLHQFPQLMKTITEILSGVPKDEIEIVSFGGGSVGDFSGFVASIYKRGVPFHQIPSTWLAAIDSAHGGKNALNVGTVKNQLGTFYPANSVYLVRDVLTNISSERVLEVLGEFYKIGLIEGGKLWENMKKNPTLDPQILWKFLPKLIAAKMEVVKKDPFEKTGHRQILNFGHTVGHVLESANNLAHGTAVLYGLKFSYEFGRRLGVSNKVTDLDWILPSKQDLKEQLKKVRHPETYLSADKKTTAHQKVHFIFMKTPGQMIRRPVSLDQLMEEWKRQSR